jgi:hypothetical protein
LKVLKSGAEEGWRRLDKISWTDPVKNKAVLHRVKEERNILQTIQDEKLTGLVTCCVRTAS